MYLQRAYGTVFIFICREPMGQYSLGWVDFWRKFDFEWKYPWNMFIFMKKYRK
jgi:hypothetical protein